MREPVDDDRAPAREGEGSVGPDPPEARLCLTCGLCCDGTIFRWVELRADDPVAVLRSAGIVVAQINTRKTFAQPCAALHDCRCAVYQDRPDKCRQFRCNLLVAYQSGAVSWNEARARIDRVVAIRDDVRRELGRLAPRALEGDLMAATPPDDVMASDPALRRTWAPVLMRMALLLELVKTLVFDRSVRPDAADQ